MAGGEKSQDETVCELDGDRVELDFFFKKKNSLNKKAEVNSVFLLNYDG